MSDRRTAGQVRARPSAILRIGRIPDLNMYPVRHGLYAASLEQVEYVDGPPTLLNAQLLAGRLDASVISSAAFLRARDQLMLLPSSITAPGGWARSFSCPGYRWRTSGPSPSRLAARHQSPCCGFSSPGELP